ncbi:alanyl-tRNA synthetase [Jatrophihabitans endophyticus]|uniref:Alanine--tRNA ligase n=1 Tax=Jatrophihabitans endophyticus TaxID=1206085 RepID=A0A1M5LMK1_9ACTN|nr:alanine--tRNA ligase [Jatrophihabitans endophyticus]SHG65879.1 alanyl-tRNA synthetase [Jatrophihabitans endophyticus]
MKSAEIRARFLGHFERNGHAVVPSAPLPFDDPNLLFVNAGMVQFVPYFVGQQTPPWPRATSVQKVIRTPDIDEVGKTTRHGTFFQMNGNFSFGDYFKSDAVRLAWELSTNPVEQGGFGLDGERIWATVYLDDDEAVDIWHSEIGLPLDRIVRKGMDDNFWSMGIPGPCGPCSELYYDRGPDYGIEGGPAVDEDRYMEFWNLVFMQNERGANTGPGKSDYPVLGELPRKNIDTGMGMERMATLLQGVDNMYEIDETRPVLDRAATLAGKVYGAHSGHAASESHPDDVRLRIVADHVRTALMLIGDGVTPANEGRGYVLRRIMRRAIRAMRLLGVQEPVLPELLPVSRDAMAPSYPELATDFGRIEMIAYAEEDTFLRTLASGTTILDTAVAQTKAQGGAQLSGTSAFQLHDTYGFPIDLTLEMAAEQGLTVDQEGFRTLMAEQRQRAKADSRSKKTAHADLSVFRTLRDQGETPFTGYEELETETTVRGLVRDGALVPAAQQGESVEVVLDRTPFYAESGGQIADEGVIRVGDATLQVLDVQKAVKGLIVHRAVVASGEVVSGAGAVASVDPEWRTSARQAHSGTHIVHAALRHVLGPSALQSGSYNKPGYLRLDFAWGRALDAATRADIEDVANQALRRDLPVGVQYVSLAQARELGALALFGETYDEIVRVVEIGGAWSRELCGGTHVAHASQVGTITLLGESSVGSGLRRVEAYVGIEAMRHLATERALVAGLADTLKVPADQVPDRVAALVERLRVAERELGRLKAAAVLSSAGELAAGAESVVTARGAVQLVAAAAAAGVAGNDLRSLALDVRNRLAHGEAGVVLLASPDEKGGAAFVAAVNDAGQQAGLRAGDLVKAFAPVLGARGGGKADVAQGAGGDAGKLTDALAVARAYVADPA